MTDRIKRRDIIIVNDCIDVTDDLIKEHLACGFGITKSEIIVQPHYHPNETRAAMAEELLGYRKQHSAVYGNAMTYIDEEQYLKEIQEKVNVID